MRLLPRKRLFSAPKPGESRATVAFYAPQRQRDRRQIPAQPRDVTLAKRGRKATVERGPKVPLGLVRAQEREQQRGRAKSRGEQGWSQRWPLSRVRLKHDGSTAEQRARRTKNRTSPWIPA